MTTPKPTFEPGKPKRKFLDYDARRKPKTDHFCIKCQRDLKPGQPFRIVHVHEGAFAIHPEGPQPASDVSAYPIGMDCARSLGMEWTIPGNSLVTGGNAMSDISYCSEASEHEPGTTCEYCNLPVDKYGNTEGDFRNCSFPDCGCDGARLCMAGTANHNARECNVEGMWTLKGSDQGGAIVRARVKLLGICVEREAK